MEGIYLGHACWLIEAAGLRLLVDPLLFPLHQRGVFTLSPPRTLDVDALRPDYLLISHAHPDHFDLPSLFALARRDPEIIVFSPDEQVCSAARRLGFQQVQRVSPGSKIELDGVRILTSPSADPNEWGVLVEQDGCVLWHLVDTVLEIEGIRGFLEDASRELGVPALAERGPDLAMVRYQPLLEVALALGEAGGFPQREYLHLLRAAEALGAATVVPSSSSSVHASPFACMNTAVYPQTEARFLRDLSRYAPKLRGLSAVLGGRYRVTPGRAWLGSSEGESWIAEQGPPSETIFRPDRPPPLLDPEATGSERSREKIRAWIEGPLCDNLRGWLGAAGASWILALEIVHPEERDVYTFHIHNGTIVIQRVLDGDYDLLNAVAASALESVLEGERSWVDVLLAGRLRASDRRISARRGDNAARRGPFFVHAGLSVEESVERATEREISRLLRGGDG